MKLVILLSAILLILYHYSHCKARKSRYKQNQNLLQIKDRMMKENAKAITKIKIKKDNLRKTGDGDYIYTLNDEEAEKIRKILGKSKSKINNDEESDSSVGNNDEDKDNSNPITPQMNILDRPEYQNTNKISYGNGKDPDKDEYSSGTSISYTYDEKSNSVIQTSYSKDSKYSNEDLKKKLLPLPVIREIQYVPQPVMYPGSSVYVPPVLPPPGVYGGGLAPVVVGTLV